MIARRVERTERLALLIPAASAGVLAVALLVPMWIGHLRDMLVLGLLLAAGAAALAGWLVRLAVTTPLRTARYGDIAWVLGGQVRDLAAGDDRWRSWLSPTPGGLAVTEAGKLVLVDRSTGYDQLWLTGADIVEVSVERDMMPAAAPAAGGSGANDGPKPPSATPRQRRRPIATADLAIRYRFVPNGAVSKLTVPFGGHRQSAHGWCEAIERLRLSA